MINRSSVNKVVIFQFKLELWPTVTFTTAKTDEVVIVALIPICILKQVHVYLNVYIIMIVDTHV